MPSRQPRSRTAGDDRSLELAVGPRDREVRRVDGHQPSARGRAASEIEEILERRTGPAGEVYGLERDRHGKHGRIMKYDLNQ